MMEAAGSLRSSAARYTSEWTIHDTTVTSGLRKVHDSAEGDIYSLPQHGDLDTIYFFSSFTLAVYAVEEPYTPTFGVSEVNIWRQAQ
jgi:hypothetical protein